MSGIAPGTEPAVSLRVVRGEPRDAELAALVAVLATLGAAAPAPAPAPSPWAAPRLRSALPVGPGAWRRSGLPRGWP